MEKKIPFDTQYQQKNQVKYNPRVDLILFVLGLHLHVDYISLVFFLLVQGAAKVRALRSDTHFIAFTLGIKYGP